MRSGVLERATNVPFGRTGPSPTGWVAGGAGDDTRPADGDAERSAAAAPEQAVATSAESANRAIRRETGMTLHYPLAAATGSLGRTTYVPSRAKLSITPLWWNW